MRARRRIKTVGKISRRKFLKEAGAAGTALSVGRVGKHRPSDGTVHWGMIIDLQRCVGCGACAAACKAENHTPPGVSYILVMDEEVGTYPDVRRRYLARPCMQCQFSSCTVVCPTKATYRREDGIVVVDYDKCIGCRYCISACPYGARYFDYGHNYHDLPTPYEQQPSPEYGENRKRQPHTSPIGNVQKCTFCLHRIKKNLNPACAETCIGRAIHFGNLADPKARCRVHGEKLRELLATRAHMRLKEEIGNDPSVYYLT